MQRLTGLDAGFLYLETPSSPMHVAGTYVLDPSTAPGGWSFDRVRATLEARLHLVPPYRRRLAEIPLGLHHPIWVEDPDFDLGRHLHHVVLPPPGGRAQLAELAAEVMGRPLDRSRPLWELNVVEGLEGGRVAVVAKTHHAVIDGVSGVDVTVNLFDLEADPPPPPPPAHPWVPDAAPGTAELVGHGIGMLARQPLRAVGLVRRAAGALPGVPRGPAPEPEPDPDEPASPAPFQAPRTSFNGRISAGRSFGMAEVPLDDVKAVRRALDGTVNDVVLALCGGALRSYLEDRGERPDEPLVAMCPISIRTADERGAMGNRVTAMLVSLATTVDDPVERLRAVSAGAARGKARADGSGPETLSQVVELLTPAVAVPAVRLYSRSTAAPERRPLFNLTISNVPGPQVPLYLAGARLVAWYPMAPVVDGVGLNITVMSYLGSMYVGVVADRASVPDAQRLADGVVEALAELREAAGGVAAPPGS